MSNLGPYQDMTISAKAAGGVEQYIAAIQSDALWRRGPMIALAGLITGAAGVTGIQALVERRRAAREAAVEAKAALREEPDA